MIEYKKGDRVLLVSPLASDANHKGHTGTIIGKKSYYRVLCDCGKGEWTCAGGDDIPAGDYVFASDYEMQLINHGAFERLKKLIAGIKE